MAITRDESTALGRLLRFASEDLAFAAASLGVPLGALATMAVAPQPIVLPILSVLLVGAGVLLAGWSWLVRAPEDPIRRRAFDFAGALLFCGFAAALLSESPEALRCFSELETTLTCSPTVSTL